MTTYVSSEAPTHQKKINRKKNKECLFEIYTSIRVSQVTLLVAHIETKNQIHKNKRHSNQLSWLSRFKTDYCWLHNIYSS